jgi:hypothetical protein
MSVKKKSLQFAGMVQFRLEWVRNLSHIPIPVMSVFVHTILIMQQFRKIRNVENSIAILSSSIHSSSVDACQFSKMINVVRLIGNAVSEK